MSNFVTYLMCSLRPGRVNAQSDLGRGWYVSVLEELLDAAEQDYNKRRKPEVVEK
ncbi:TPA: hypothetical protein ACX6PV_003760 [Photobacterium damselae]